MKLTERIINAQFGARELIKTTQNKAFFSASKLLIIKEKEVIHEKNYHSSVFYFDFYLI